jgi:hypothetical protein
MIQSMTVAGWYPDPADAALLRWWDGNQWTGQVHAVGHPQAAAEVPAPEPASHAKPDRAARKEAKAAEKALKLEAERQAAAEREAARAAEREAGHWWVDVPTGMVGSAIYRGSRGRGKTAGIMRFTGAGIQWSVPFKKVVIPWNAIEAIDIDGETSKRVTVTRALTIGVFALGAKKKREDCQLSVLTPSMEYAFTFEKTPAVRIRNAFRPVANGLSKAKTMAVAEVPDNQDIDDRQAPPEVTTAQTRLSDPPGSTTTGVAGQLAMLADLHAAGSLTDEEFAAAKAQLLAGAS